MLKYNFMSYTLIKRFYTICHLFCHSLSVDCIFSTNLFFGLFVYSFFFVCVCFELWILALRRGFYCCGVLWRRRRRWWRHKIRLVIHCFGSCSYFNLIHLWIGSQSFQRCKQSSWRNFLYIFVVIVQQHAKTTN